MVKLPPEPGPPNSVGVEVTLWRRGKDNHSRVAQTVNHGTDVLSTFASCKLLTS